MDEMSKFLEVTELLVDGTAKWVVSIKNIFIDIENKAKENIKKYTYAAISYARDKVISVFEEVFVDYRTFELFDHSEKELDDYVNIYNRFGKDIFKKAIIALIDSMDRINTTPIQKMWGICRTIKSQA